MEAKLPADKNECQSGMGNLNLISYLQTGNFGDGNLRSFFSTIRLGGSLSNNRSLNSVKANFPVIEVGFPKEMDAKLDANGRQTPGKWTPNACRQTWMPIWDG
ncbi:hypothetical protein CDAR_63801 [Caerostris darwini]|uniref:Uncharacterized protein n=1 Tax=Caerostris darwini TaxID=1538125 RepID=A0AAV4R291_9ARAC|nr:hypothetical protein CDAR_63801 [Caerostris darwini]